MISSVGIAASVATSWQHLGHCFGASPRMLKSNPQDLGELPKTVAEVVSTSHAKAPKQWPRWCQHARRKPQNSGRGGVNILGEIPKTVAEVVSTCQAKTPKQWPRWCQHPRRKPQNSGRGDVNILGEIPKTVAGVVAPFVLSLNVHPVVVWKTFATHVSDCKAHIPHRWVAKLFIWFQRGGCWILNPSASSWRIVCI